MNQRLGRILALAALLAAGAAHAQEKVRTFSINAYTGFSVYAAKELGLFAKNGIDTDPRFFPSGAPIVQAAAAKEWDMTFLGAPPAVLAGPSLGLVTVGMVAEEGSMHELIGRPEFVAAVRKDPAKLKGAKIFVTTLSTGHYMVEACLNKLGVNASQVSIIPSDQQSTLSAFAAGQGDLAQVWSPQNTSLRQRGNQVLCDARQTRLSMPAVWVAHPDFVKRKPELVAKWIKANLEAIDALKKDPARAFELYKKYDRFRGFNYTDELLKEEMEYVMGTYLTGREQLPLLAQGSGAKAPIVKSYEDISQFFIRQGRLKEVPNFQPLVDDRYLKSAVGP